MIRIHVLFRALIGCLVWVSVSSVVLAVEVKDLYQASVPVADRTVKARSTAVSNGFLDVLVKVSGSSLIAQQDVIREARSNAERFVVQFGYETREMPAAEEGARPVERTYLNVKYDVAAINQYLRRNGYPIWSSNRPSLTLWLAYDNGRGRKLVGGSAQQNLQALAMVHASRRGLPITFPKYDTRDLSRVSSGDVWGLFTDPVIAASERYQSNAVALVKMNNSGGIVNLNSVVVIDGQEQWWEHSSASLDEAVSDLVDQLADRVGGYYAVVSSQDLGQQVLLDVSGVRNLDDFAGLGEYLNGLIAVRYSFPETVQGAQVRYLVTLENNMQTLVQSFRLDNKLIPVEAPKPVKLSSGESRPLTTSASAMGAATVDESAATADPERITPSASDQGPVEPGVPTVPAPEPTLPVIYYQWQG
ncbi:MAG: DUF2066 domain-containing protein [Ketobacter sp.]